MKSREQQICHFLNLAGWADADRTVLAGDASPRKYWRLKNGARVAVLMDAVPQGGKTIQPFIEVAGILAHLGYSVPKVHMNDAALGFVLMEDLGDQLFARVIDTNAAAEASLYQCAVELLIDLAQRDTGSILAPYDQRMMAQLAGLAGSWYAGSSHIAQKIEAAMLKQLSKLSDMPQVPVHRDFHAENLVWLKSRSGISRVGILDFQDAMLGPAGYDLVSLLYDARRDVSKDLANSLTRRYANALALNFKDFEISCAALTAQRSLRILGGFSRLSLHYEKPGYISLIPRVWGHLQWAISHPALRSLRDICDENLPAPTADALLDLRARCGTIPNL